MIFKLVAFLLGIALVVLLGRLLAVSLGQLTWSNLAASYLEYLTSRRVMAGVVYLAAAALVMAFIRQTAAMVGPRVLANLMLGRYYHPREEELIFMFLDMKSSTSIAERLGHRKFSRLLQDCFRDLTDVALRHLVEIYKYVGDEAILTWRPQDGLTDSNCVATYFGFCEVLESRRSHYESAYGCFPEFKAGLNLGPVTVAEVGVLKREIAYLSDVLNTAARIQGMCNELESPILISGMLRKRLPEGAPYHYQSRGEISLRGREEQVGLFGVEGRRE
ncbi:MAG: adenylate/guanylate cyclase domain-containing protein [Akkermansiaceae bacterium]|nr:adenylate/guanylate cyclase domain-containing protein [Akkermansiaceae bacterium]